MNIISEGALLWGAKAVGALAGSAISVAYILPKGRREAAVRFAIGMVSGLVFGAGLVFSATTHRLVGGWLGASPNDPCAANPPQNASRRRSVSCGRRAPSRRRAARPARSSPRRRIRPPAR